ncbi:hypothetical protein GGR55DRAFT_502295 [Xylaria sp. FL0064]|nr:hypothetical protein GGR55DRAFT_502295 [Xylaria sp. FL0064]
MRCCRSICCLLFSFSRATRPRYWSASAWTYDDDTKRKLLDPVLLCCAGSRPDRGQGDLSCVTGGDVCNKEKATKKDKKTVHIGSRQVGL